MAEIKITKNNFQREVLQAGVPVLLDFWAAWCGPCRMLSGVISEVAAKAEGKYKVGKVNVDEEPELASAYRISSIPTLLVFKGGRAVASAVGVQPRENIEDLLGL
ncbi:thioredoxin [Bilifractor sp. LCP19S3_H10]|jgi:thioredoxin 1|uniref:thioredoxin n=1 Tax=Bilifractor sp. LCP19S3_H10 TaxID=3438736 RepID=UPI003F085E9C